MTETILSLAMLVAAALIWGGIRLIRGAKETRKGWLMIVAALTFLGNVLIIVWP